jgi:hypothetical protein
MDCTASTGHFDRNNMPVYGNFLWWQLQQQQQQQQQQQYGANQGNATRKLN